MSEKFTISQMNAVFQASILLLLPAKFFFTPFPQSLGVWLTNFYFSDNGLFNHQTFCVAISNISKPS